MYRTVKYELFTLEAWLVSGRRPDRVLLSKVNAEVDRIRDSLLTNVVSLTDSEHVTRYVRCHHFGIIQVINKLSGKSGSLMEVCDLLLELLKEVENNFTALLDSQAELCLPHSHKVHKICLDNVSWLRKVLEKNPVSEKLQESLIYIFKNIQKSASVSYHQRQYLQTFQHELREILGNTSHQNTEDSLSRFVLYMNCNTPTSFDYWRTRITTQLQEIEVRSDKRDCLVAIQQQVQFMPFKSDVHFHPQNVSLRDQILEFITQELGSLDRGNWQAVKINTDNVSESFRVRTELSVSQLACFLKTLVDSRIILNPNVSELLRIFSQTFVSKRTEAISFDSLRAKYYNIEAGTKETLRQTLQNLMKYL